MRCFISWKCICYLQCLRSRNWLKKNSHRPVAIHFLDSFSFSGKFTRQNKWKLNKPAVFTIPCNFTQFHSMHSQLNAVHFQILNFYMKMKSFHACSLIIVQDFHRRIYHTYTTYFNGALSGLRQFLATENAFYFTTKALFVFKIFKLLSWLFAHVSKRLD